MGAAMGLLKLIAIPFAAAWASPNFETREAASDLAKSWRPAVVVALMLVDDPDPEVSLRAECVLRARHWPARPAILWAAAFAFFHHDGSEAVSESLLSWWCGEGRLEELRRLAILIGAMSPDDVLPWDAEPTFWMTQKELIRDGIRAIRAVTLGEMGPEHDGR